MKTLLKILSATTVVTGLAACSFSGDSTADQTKQYLDDRNQLLSMYEPIKGTYEGTLDINQNPDESSAQTKSVKLQLTIYTQDVQNGTDPNGQAKPLPNLIVRYRQLDIVRPDELMGSARYVPESGALFATNTASSGGGGSSGSTTNPVNTATNICNTAGTILTTLKDAQIKGDTITGKVFRNNGELGHFTVKRTSTTAFASVTDPISDCNDRLVSVYKGISGLYKGTITHTPENGGKVMDVSLNVNYMQVVSNGTPITTLMANFQYGTVGVQMTAVYRQDVVPAQLLMSFLNSAASGGGFSLSGSLVNDTFSGEAYSGNVGHLGTVLLKKVSQ